MDTAITRSRVHEQLLELKMKHAERSVDRLCEEAVARQTGYTELREHSRFVNHCRASSGAAQASFTSSFQRWAL